MTGNGSAGATDIATFVCPSDPNTLVQVTGLCSYYETVGTLASGEWRSASRGGTNYVFSAGTGSSFNWFTTLGTNLRPDLGGVFSPNTNRAFKDIVDGTSNTLALGEVLWVDHYNNQATGLGNGGKPLWSSGFATQIAFTTGGGINAVFPCKGPSTTQLEGPTCGPVRSAALQSKHTGGVNVTLADGSVRFISQSITQTTLDGLATRANNEVPGDY